MIFGSLDTWLSQVTRPKADGATFTEQEMIRCPKSRETPFLTVSAP